jgi:hypothetical protein
VDDARQEASDGGQAALVLADLACELEADRRGRVRRDEDAELAIFVGEAGPVTLPVEGQRAERLLVVPVERNGEGGVGVEPKEPRDLVGLSRRRVVRGDSHDGAVLHRVADDAYAFGERQAPEATGVLLARGGRLPDHVEKEVAGAGVAKRDRRPLRVARPHRLAEHREEDLLE